MSITNRKSPATSVVITPNFIFFRLCFLRFPAYLNSELTSQALNLPRVNNSVSKRTVTFGRRFPFGEKLITSSQLSDRVCVQCVPRSLLQGEKAGAWNSQFSSILPKFDEEWSHILPCPLHKSWFFVTCSTNISYVFLLWILFNIGRIPRRRNRPHTALILDCKIWPTGQSRYKVQTLFFIQMICECHRKENVPLDLHSSGILRN